jgi:hypothetical protein
VARKKNNPRDLEPRARQDLTAVRDVHIEAYLRIEWCSKTGGKGVPTLVATNASVLPRTCEVQLRANFPPRDVHDNHSSNHPSETCKGLPLTTAHFPPQRVRPRDDTSRPCEHNERPDRKAQGIQVRQHRLGEPVSQWDTASRESANIPPLSWNLTRPFPTMTKKRAYHRQSRSRTGAFKSRSVADISPREHLWVVPPSRVFSKPRRAGSATRLWRLAREASARASDAHRPRLRGRPHPNWASVPLLPLRLRAVRGRPRHLQSSPAQSIVGAFEWDQVPRHEPQSPTPVGGGQQSPQGKRDSRQIRFPAMVRLSNQAGSKRARCSGRIQKRAGKKKALKARRFSPAPHSPMGRWPKACIGHWITHPTTLRGAVFPGTWRMRPAGQSLSSHESARSLPRHPSFVTPQGPPTACRARESSPGASIGA